MTANLPVTAAKLPPLTGCDVKSMLPHECDAHRKAICLEVEIVLKGYWQDKRSFEMDPSLEKIAHTDGDVNDLLLEQKK